MTTTRGRGRAPDRGPADRGEQAEVARAEHRALLEQQVAARRRPRRRGRTCWPRLGRLGDPHLGDAAVGPLVGDDRVGARRHRGAGHDLDRGARATARAGWPGRRRSRRRPAGAPGCSSVAPATSRVTHGVAVHRGVVEARQRRSARRRPRRSGEPERLQQRLRRRRAAARRAARIRSTVLGDRAASAQASAVRAPSRTVPAATRCGRGRPSRLDVADDLRRRGRRSSRPRP